MILVIDYGMGNLRSIEKALRKVGVDFKVSSAASDIDAASAILLPGVGSFGEGMRNLKRLGILKPLTKAVIGEKKPLLGVCLGMQLLFKTSEEGGSNGLGFIDGEVRKFSFAGANANPGTRAGAKAKMKIPHMGWNDVFGPDLAKMPLFKNLDEHTNFYFVHSYHAVPKEVAACGYTNYGYDFVSAIQKGNIFGTQFHPEKSQKKGLELLKNFASFAKYAKD